ncbi:MAG: LacI family transcriptional regulator [Ruminococcaceae bacterium]|nr:LacI family transcriptional regulator [Oscillospiraceae bacterium]
MATIKDVARMAGVAPSTISKYINGGKVRKENVEPIEKAIAALDYRANPFARGLKAGHNRSIGVLIPDMIASFYGNVVMNLARVVREQDYHCLISSYGANHGMERDNLKFLLTCGIDGLIYAPEDLSADEFNELTAHCGIPIVLIDRTIPGVEVDAVLVDNVEVVYEAVTRLLEKGHTRVGIIAGPKSVYTAKERMVGYLRAISDAGILYDEDLIISGKNEFATGYRGMEKLLKLPEPPTAIIATNDDITMGMVTALHEHPHQLAEKVEIFGFDRVDMCSMVKPPLPVIQQPEQAIGRAAAQFLLERMDGHNGPARVQRLNCKIVSK